jgi:hypothetical protein
MTGDQIRLKLRTAVKLGLPNVGRLLWYKFQLKSGIGPAALAPRAAAGGDVFRAPAPDSPHPEPPSALPLRYFGWLESSASADRAPDWFLNPDNGLHFSRVDAPWHKLPDFDAAFGDIKWVWELSRWDWIIRFAQHVRHGADPFWRETLNRWLTDWLSKNPPYRGPNWKCGQETSLRVLNLAYAARLLDQVARPSKPLIEIVLAHLDRIAASTHYAIAQDNNHGTSEGAALFIGGTWMMHCKANGKNIAYEGRRLIENRVARLVMPDGTFSQYSVNYHRLMLDTLSMAELWRRDKGEPEFSATFYERARAATEWLRAMVSADSGDAPNIGANDGARLLQFTAGYRDYRPSVQLASALFWDRSAYGPGPWNDGLRWLGLDEPATRMAETGSRIFSDGGFAILCKGDVRIFARFPRFRFRPGHADALHVDLWYRERNILRDSGTYSYGTTPDRMAHFMGCEGHNTIQFDNRDQMPKISRFLYGRWLESEDVAPIRERADGSLEWGAAYTDWLGARHRRTVVLSGETCEVSDTVSHFKSKAVLRWHLAPGAWTLKNNVLEGNDLRLELRSNGTFDRVRLVESDASLYYGRADRIPVLEIEMTSPATVITSISWPSPATSGVSRQ